MKTRLSSFVVYKIIFGAIVVGLMAYGWIQRTPHHDGYDIGDNTICFETNCIDLMVVATDADRQQGLMNVESLPIGSGMLFVFETDNYHTFWMKNTLITLDAIWIDTQGKIIDIQSMPPCTADPCSTYRPIAPSRYVLEINGGLSALLSLQIGSIAQFSQK